MTAAKARQGRRLEEEMVARKNPRPRGGTWGTRFFGDFDFVWMRSRAMRRRWTARVIQRARRMSGM
jgi:hypothetical protein